MGLRQKLNTLRKLPLSSECYTRWDLRLWPITFGTQTFLMNSLTKCPMQNWRRWAFVPCLRPSISRRKHLRNWANCSRCRSRKRQAPFAAQRGVLSKEISFPLASAFQGSWSYIDRSTGAIHVSHWQREWSSFFMSSIFNPMFQVMSLLSALAWLALLARINVWNRPSTHHYFMDCFIGVGGPCVNYCIEALHSASSSHKGNTRKLRSLIRSINFSIT